jgi:hypothetical protein
VFRSQVDWHPPASNKTGPGEGLVSRGDNARWLSWIKKGPSTY